MKNVIFSLIGLDVDGNIIRVGNIKDDLEFIKKVLSDYKVEIKEGVNGNDISMYATVYNPYDFEDIISDLNI